MGDGLEAAKVRRALALWSAALAVGLAASWARFAFAGTVQLGLRVPGTSAALWALALGLAAAGALQAWLARDRAAGALPPRAVLRWALATYALLALALPLTSTDLFVHLAYGRLHLAGLNSYAVGPSALPDADLVELIYPKWRDLSNIYGPVTTLVLWGAVALGTPVGAALGHPLLGGAAGIRLAMLGLTALAAWAAFRHAEDEPADPARRRGLALLALSPLVAWELAGQGHNDALMVAGIALFFLAAARARRALAVLALSLALWSKLTCAPLVGLYLLAAWRDAPARERPRVLGLAAVPLAVAAAAYLPFWTGAGTMRANASFVGEDATRTANSLAGLATSLLRDRWPEAVEPAYYAFLGLSLALPLAWLAWQGLRRHDLAGQGRVFAVTLLLWFIATPWFQAWYVTWILPVVMVERDPRWQRFLATYAALTAAMWALPRLGYWLNVALVAWTAWTLAGLIAGGARSGSRGAAAPA